MKNVNIAAKVQIRAAHLSLKKKKKNLAKSKSGLPTYLIGKIEIIFFFIFLGTKEFRGKPYCLLRIPQCFEPLSGAQNRSINDNGLRQPQQLKRFSSTNSTSADIKVVYNRSLRDTH